MAYSVKTIKGRKYLYWQRSYRVGAKVKTISKYIGALSFAAAPIATIAKHGAVEKFTRSDADILASRPVPKGTPTSNWNAESVFQHESGTKSGGPFTTAAPSSDQAAQSSAAADASEAAA